MSSNPIDHDDDTYVVEDDKIFRLRRSATRTTKHLVAGFVVQPMLEASVFADRDAPGEPVRLITVRYEYRDAEGTLHCSFVEIAAPLSADLGPS